MKTLNEVVALLVTSDAAVERAMLALDRRQTEEERAHLVSFIRNNRGFDKFSARRGSTYARWILSSSQPAGKRLSERSLREARRIALKHSKQLTEHVNEEEREAAQFVAV